MVIDVQRDRHTTVPQPLLNHLGASTQFQKRSSMSMSQVMGLDLAYARLFADVAECMGRRAIQGSSVNKVSASTI